MSNDKFVSKQKASVSSPDSTPASVTKVSNNSSMRAVLCYLFPTHRLIAMQVAFCIFAIFGSALGVFSTFEFRHVFQLNDNLERLKSLVTEEKEPLTGNQYGVTVSNENPVDFRIRFTKRPGVVPVFSVFNYPNPAYSNSFSFSDPNLDNGPVVVRENYIDQEKNPIVLEELKSAREVEMRFQATLEARGQMLALDRFTMEFDDNAGEFYRSLVRSTYLLFFCIPTFFLLRKKLQIAFILPALLLFLHMVWTYFMMITSLFWICSVFIAIFFPFFVLKSFPTLFASKVASHD